MRGLRWILMGIGLSWAGLVMAKPIAASITFNNKTGKNVSEELFAYSCGISQEPQQLILLRPGVTVITFSSSNYAAMHYCQIGITLSPFLERRSVTLQGSVEGREGVVTNFNPDMRVSYRIPDFDIHLQTVTSSSLVVDILPGT